MKKNVDSIFIGGYSDFMTEKKNRGRPKGATSFVRIALRDLLGQLGENGTVVVSKKWLQEIGVSVEPTINKPQTIDEAQEEVEKLLGHKIEPVQDIKFHTGRLSKFWDKNVISTGLASAFMEPLEATSIHGTIMQITHFFEHYYTPHLKLGDPLENQYNAEMTGMWDSFRDFLVNRYITPRTEPFWVDARQEFRRSDRLQNQLEMWKLRSPRYIDYSTDKHGSFYNLSNILWYHQFIGMKQIDKDMVRQELIDYNLYEYAEAKYNEIKESMEEILPNMESTDSFYANHI